MSTDQDWIGLDQDWSLLWPDQGWIGLQIFDKWQIRTESGREHFCSFNMIILIISKILLVIRFYRFSKWQCTFFHQWQKLWWDHFAIRTVFTCWVRVASSTWNVLWLWTANKRRLWKQVQKITWKFSANVIEQHRQRRSIRISMLKIASPNGWNSRRVELEQSSI